MLAYSDIVKKAYRITISYPLLWVFGLFVVGGFNLNFLSYENIPLKNLLLRRSFLELTAFFQSHPGLLALLSLSVLLVTLLGLVVSNWSRIMLIVSGEAVLKTRFLNLDQQLPKTKTSLWTVIKISLSTTTLIFVVALGLFAPILLWDINQTFQILLFALAGLVFMALLFVISCINIFTTFYAVIYKKSFGAALDLGADLFMSRWLQILGLVVVLVTIYIGAFFIGISLIGLARGLFDLIFLLFLRFNILSFSAIIMILKFISNILLWFLLAGLSVFFNQALLILFLELNKPIEVPERTKEAKPAPAALT